MQLRAGRSNSSFFVEIPKEDKTDNDCQGFLLWVYVGLSSELSIPNSCIKQSMYCDLQTKTMLLGALSVGATTYLL